MNERRNLMIAAGAAFAITLLAFMFLIRPKFAQIAEARAQIAEAQAEESRLRGEITRLEAIRRDAPATIARLARISQYLPSEPRLPEFIRAVQSASTLAGVDLRSIAPSQPNPLVGATGIDTITVSLVMEGSYPRMQDFMARLENLQRVVQTTAFSFAPEIDPLSGRVQLNATLTMTMYVVQPNATIKPAGGATTPPPGGN